MLLASQVYRRHDRRRHRSLPPRPPPPLACLPQSAALRPLSLTELSGSLSDQLACLLIPQGISYASALAHLTRTSLLHFTATSPLARSRSAHED